jgi:Zn-dependent protease
MPLPIAFQVPSFDVIVAIAIVIFFALGLHEYSHAKFADMAGDPTPGMYGRVTLDLTKHFELMGTIMIVFTSLAGFGIGWGKPVPMDPRKMRNPRWDHFVAVLAGPASNLIQAGVYAIALRAVALTAPSLLLGFLGTLLLFGVMINISLCLFNLLPIGPLDGMWIAGTFMREPTRLAWTRFNLGPGQFLFLFLVLFGQMMGGGVIAAVIDPPRRAIFQFLTGMPL